MKNFKIVYHDADLLIVDKPQGMPTTPGKNTVNLYDEVSKNFSVIRSLEGFKKNEGGLLNRLDNETGGLVFFALSNTEFKYYSDQMKNNKIIKIYHAIVEGIADQRDGKIEYPIAHDKKNKKKMICLNKKLKHRSRSRPCLTEWKLIDVKNDSSLLEIRITKGMRHQIRVHLSCVGHPIVGDKLYNKKGNPDIPNHKLYCTGASFTTPLNEKIEINIKSPFNLEDI